jgi:glycerol-1-phosphate dehydrogenase [NAD(P)+]
MNNNERVIRALDAAAETQALEIGVGVLPRVAPLFLDHFPGKKALPVADTNTWKAAGARVEETLKAAGIACETPYIFDAPDFHADYEHVETLDRLLSATDAVVVAVGSGTINDLVKLGSGHQRRPYFCVATAASVDGYTSYGASITVKGSKITLECPAPRVVLADTQVLAGAPYAMTAAGYADLAAKIPAGADWILADALGLDPIHEVAFDIVQGGLADALADPEGVARLDPQALVPLIEGLMLSGFAMQASRTSRPASGAEHMFSHLWDMSHHTHRGETPSHGFKVSIGTLATVALYEQLFRTGLSDLDVKGQVSRWPSLEEAQALALKLFEGSDFPRLGYDETTAKYPDKKELRKELTYLKENWEDLYPALRRQILPFDELSRRLKVVGAPTEPEQIGISRRQLRDSYLPAAHLRRRFMALDLALRTGNLDRWLDGIFGPEGVFSITN